MSEELETVTPSGVEASDNCGCGGGLAIDPETESAPPLADSGALASDSSEANPNPTAVVPTASPVYQSPSSQPTPTAMPAQITPSQAPSDLASSQLAYALGTLGYDFGSEARRDTFKQLMPP